MFSRYPDPGGVRRAGSHREQREWGRGDEHCHRGGLLPGAQRHPGLHPADQQQDGPEAVRQQEVRAEGEEAVRGGGSLDHTPLQHFQVGHKPQKK